MGHSQALRVVHVFRAPLGGLFRHVIDLSAEQARRGLDVGLFFDASGDCARVRDALARIPGGLRLGAEMTPIARNPGLQDIAAHRAFSRYLKRVGADVVHGHGSKGGLLARLSGGLGAGGPIRAYTPHGGSFNYKPGSVAHGLYMQVERALARRTDVFLFESDHIRQKYDEKVGVRAGISRIVVNGLGDREFAPVTPAADATDVLYIGELRAAKGIDTLLDALALAGRVLGRPLTATLVGSGPDRFELMDRAARLGIAAQVRFPGPMPAAEALPLGRLMVAPSRAESMPYVVLETAAAQVPMITTHVGGIPEIYGPYRDRLCAPDDAGELARRIVEEVRRPPEESAARVGELAAYVHGRFSLENMAETVISSYREALARRRHGRPLRQAGDAAARIVNEA